MLQKSWCTHSSAPVLTTATLCWQVYQRKPFRGDSMFEQCCPGSHSDKEIGTHHPSPPLPPLASNQPKNNFQSPSPSSQGHKHYRPNLPPGPPHPSFHIKDT